MTILQLYGVAITVIMIITVALVFVNVKTEMRETVMYKEALRLNAEIKKVKSVEEGKELSKKFMPFYLKHIKYCDKHRVDFCYNSLVDFLQFKHRLLRLQETMYQSKVQEREEAVTAFVSQLNDLKNGN